MHGWIGEPPSFSGGEWIDDEPRGDGRAWIVTMALGACFWLIVLWAIARRWL